MLIIVIGAGEVGFNVAAHLSREFKDIVVIDKDEEKLERVSELLDVRTLSGSGSSMSVLRKAEIHKADILIAATDSDEVNMISCLVAGIQSRIPKKVARIRDPEYATSARLMGPERLGIDLVINTDQEVVDSILRILETHKAKDVVDLAEGRLRMASFVAEEQNPFSGKHLQELRDILTEKRLIVAAVLRGEKVIIPRGDDKIQPHDLVYVLGTPQAVSEIFLSFDPANARPARRVMIYGGNSLGLRLAQALEKRDLQVWIVDPSEERCELLASELDNATVLKGDFTSSEIMREEGVQKLDAFLALTVEEEKNILVSLLARRMGCKRVIALTNRVGYIPLAYQTGVDVVISPSLIAINRILQYVRRGRIANVVLFPEGQAELLEVEAMETSDLVAGALKELGLPRGILVGAITRNQDVIIPTGETRIQPGDRVVMVVGSDSLKLLEKIVSVKIEYW
jgi:trk system potassium uptake protein TrkA